MIARREVGSGAGMVPALCDGEQTGAEAELASGRAIIGPSVDAASRREGGE